MPEHADDVYITTCGPKGFNENNNALLTQLGYISGISRP